MAAPSASPTRRFTVALAALVTAALVLGLTAALAPASRAAQPAVQGSRLAAAADCSVNQSGAAVPAASSGRTAVRTMIGVAKTMGVPIKGQIVAVMVMYQESTIRNLANDGTSTQASAWPAPGRQYWLNLTRLSLKYPHDRFGLLDAAHDTDSIGLYQQRPAWGWGNYGASTGLTDPEGVVQRLLDPRWETMAFFGGTRSAAPTSGLLDVPNWQSMAPTDAAEAVQGSTRGDLYAQWEPAATQYVNDNQDAPAIALPWTPGGGSGALACTSIPTDTRLGEAGRNPIGALDVATLEGTSVRVIGWMLDPDAANGLGSIHFYDAGPFGTSGYPTGLATLTRDDVNRAYNVLGNYGYSTLLPWTGPGAHTICAYGINVGRGTGNALLGCRTIDIPGPIGSVDGVHTDADGSIDVVGWAADPGSPGSREEVHIYVTGPDGTRGTPGTYTGDERRDVAAAFGWAGQNQGFHASVPAVGEGANNVCVYALNVKPPNTNPLLGCRSTTVLTYPIGSLDDVTVQGNQALVSGWNLDPLVPADARPVHIYVSAADGRLAGTPFTAARPRPDVNAVLGVPGNHGFAERVSLFPGSNSVCAFAIGTISNHNTLLGCRTVLAPAAATARAPLAENPAGGATSTAAAQPSPTTSRPTTPSSSPVTNSGPTPPTAPGSTPDSRTSVDTSPVPSSSPTTTGTAGSTPG